jgi:hypothetical protein
MNLVLGVLFPVIGIALILTGEWSAQFRDRWNRKFAWTRWAAESEESAPVLPLDV